MKKNVFLFLLRFLIITLIYSLEYLFLEKDYFILDIVLNPVFFPFMLVMYFMIIVISFFCGEKTVTILKVVTDIVFVLIFSFQTILLLYLGLEDIGDGGLAVAGIVLYIPIFICFIIWLVRDLKALSLRTNLKNIKFKHFYWSFFLRCIIIGVVFLGLFILQTISMMYYLFMEFTKLEPNLINMLGYAPLIVFFAFWLMRDIKLLKKILSENSMKEFDEKPFN